MMNIINSILIILEERISNYFMIKNKKFCEDILNYQSDKIPPQLLGERSYPTEPQFIESGWYKKMLLRYSIAAMMSKRKVVFDSCSGLGWGTRIIDQTAKTILGMDNVKDAIMFSKKKFPISGGYLIGDALQVPIKSKQFDIVTAMETIEHFPYDSTLTYLKELFRLLKWGGILIGSTPLVSSREEADLECDKNEFHHYIFTRDEIVKQLKQSGFKFVYVFRTNPYFIALKV